MMEEINPKLIQKLESLGLNNLHSLAVLFIVNNSSLFDPMDVDEYIHESEMGEYLIRSKVIQKQKGQWELLESIFDNSSEKKNWVKFKSLLFSDYGFTLKGHSNNPIGYLIKDEGKCITALNELLKTANMEDILEQAEQYYREGEYLKNLDNWLSIMTVGTPKVKNKFI